MLLQPSTIFGARGASPAELIVVGREERPRMTWRKTFELEMKANGHSRSGLTRPSGKLPFECQKMAKNLPIKNFYFPKIVIFFQKIANGNFFENMKIFGIFWGKMSSLFANF